tara:strand:- start:29359 stop:31311 length:1953 start_codon:yes stop_codon:yes gene_type:complete
MARKRKLKGGRIDLRNGGRVRAASGWKAGTPHYAERSDAQAQESRDLVQLAAEGKVPTKGIIPDAETVSETIKAGPAKQMVDTGDAKAFTAGVTTREDVTKGKTKAAKIKKSADAQGYTGAKVDIDAMFDPATSTIREGKDTAELAEKALSLAADPAVFSDEQKQRGMLDRVVGTIDEEAMATAAKIAGTDRPRMHRAKRQLRKAGLSEEEINIIGNNPEDLEESLLSYTDEQRGMVAGLPEEALVSAQLDALLKGMETGEIPVFARPAVAAVEAMMAERGLSASTVGRDALFNAIIQSAVPLAQSNAQSIKESVLSQRNIEAQAEQMNAQMRQQTALNNADKVFNLNMAQFQADQQTEMANKKFLQTTSLTEVSNQQQIAVQNAVNQTQLDLANLNTQERLAVNNAQAFLNMNMANLNNDQQGRVLEAQLEQQRMLSNQSSDNAARQFNAANRQQVEVLMTNLANTMEMQNAQRHDAMEQFNATSLNAAEARALGIDADISKFNAQILTQISQMNEQMDFNREQWNKQNAQAVEMSNVEWRRKANTINTAAQNAINQQNAQNAFGLSTQAMSFFWQELRDQADYSFKHQENELTRKTQLMATAIGNEGAGGKDNWTSTLGSLLTSIMNGTYGATPGTPGTPGPGGPRVR